MKEFILITGGAGYIGSKVASDLSKTYRIIVIDNLSTGYKFLIPKNSIFYKLDVNNRLLIEKIIKKFNVKTVLHFAGSLSVVESEKKPKKYIKNNVLGTKSLINACLNTEVQNFLFSSTCAVYKSKKGAVNESSIKKPKSVYGKTKLDAENLIIRLFKNKKISYSILRYFNVVGSDLKNKIGCINKNEQLFKNLSNNISNNRFKINIYGNLYKTKDGTCIRDYIYLDDLSKIHVESLKYMIKNKKNLILNCGYGKGYSVLDIVKKYEVLINKKLIIKFMKPRHGDIDVIFANNKKLKNKLNISFEKNHLKKMIISTLKWEHFLKRNYKLII